MAAYARTTVLVIDDDQHLLRTIADFLRFEGFEVLTAADGKQALALLTIERPDIILLDVMMPGMDGGEVAQSIRTMPALKSTPIIFTTAVVSKSEARTHDGQIGGESFLAKPFNLDELTSRIRETLSRTNAGERP
jgi:DNA-binding response OmpR family regulator